jgi:hypothetical protein
MVPPWRGMSNVCTQLLRCMIVASYGHTVDRSCPLLLYTLTFTAQELLNNLWGLGTE